MYFQLCYITTDFEFGDNPVSTSTTDRKMEFSMRKRVLEDAPTLPLEAADGFVTVTCEREMTTRLQSETVASGQLSAKKEAVDSIRREMHIYMLRTIRLIRWRANSHGRPNPIRSALGDGFRWSLDGIQWRTVADSISFKMSLHVHPQWTTEAERFLRMEACTELDEPLGHELLREAWTNGGENPRSSVVLAVAAAEVGFKQFASKMFPDTTWILESLPSPPLVKMLTELFPWSKLNRQISGIELTPPISVTETLKKAVLLRNNIVHGRPENLSNKTVNSVLTAVRDLLYFLDAVQGQEWAFYNLSADARKHFPDIKWPLLISPMI